MQGWRNSERKYSDILLLILQAATHYFPFFILKTSRFAPTRSLGSCSCPFMYYISTPWPGRAGGDLAGDATA